MSGEWRPMYYSDTSASADSDGDTDGIIYLDVPTDREYKIVSIVATIERDSDITYTAALAPRMDVVTSTAGHGATERLLGRYEAIATLTADTVANYVFFQPVMLAGDTYANALHDTNSLWVPIPAEFVISTMHRLKFWTVPSTGGEFRVFDIEGHFYIRNRVG